jgi:hypothetical protein
VLGEEIEYPIMRRIAMRRRLPLAQHLGKRQELGEGITRLGVWTFGTASRGMQ